MRPSSSLRPLCFALGAALFLFAPLCRAVDVIPPAAPAAAPVPDWSDIKNDTYDQRAHFADGAKLLMGRLDGEIAQLNAKRAGMKTDTKDWDFAMKEVNDSRDDLKARIDELPAATTPETWTDAKTKVGDAWHRSRLAVDKMGTTVTS